LEIRAALFASEVVGEHEELGPAILDPCLIDKAPRSKACKATQLGEQPMLGVLVQPPPTMEKLVSFRIGEAIVLRRSPRPHDMLQLGLLGIGFVTKAHDLLRSLLAIFPVHVEEQRHRGEVLAFERSEHCTLDLVRIVEVAEARRARAGSTSYESVKAFASRSQSGQTAFT
jgi:hypothetical protein